MSKPYSINVYDLPTVDNICNQILREVLSLPKVSIAHVIMNPGNVSLLHQHLKMSEIYYILDDLRILYLLVDKLLLNYYVHLVNICL